MEQKTTNELTDLTVKMLKLDSQLKKLTQEREACKTRAAELTGGANFLCEKGSIEFAPIKDRKVDEEGLKAFLSDAALVALCKLDTSDGALKAAALEGHFKYSDAQRFIKVERIGWRVTVKPAK